MGKSNVAPNAIPLDASGRPKGGVIPIPKGKAPTKAPEPAKGPTKAPEAPKPQAKAPEAPKAPTKAPEAPKPAIVVPDMPVIPKGVNKGDAIALTKQIVVASKPCDYDFNADFVKALGRDALRTAIVLLEDLANVK